MSTTPTPSGKAANASKPSSKQKFNGGIIFAIVFVCAIISVFYGASYYKSNTEHAIDIVDARAKQFNVVFNELIKARFRAMGIAADTLLQSRVTMEPFANRDRNALGARVDPYFALVQKRHGVEQLNFWLPPATMFYRAGAPDLGQFEASKFRRSIVAATERRDRIMTVETGQGGVVGIRAIVPVVWEDEFKGVVEYVSSFRIPLEGAAQDSKFKWGLAVSQERLTQVERPKNDAVDVPMGSDVFIDYADETTKNIFKNITFDSRGKEFQIVEGGNHLYFVKTIPVFNFAGVATISIAMVDDITAEYDSILKKALARGLSVFVMLVVIAFFVYYKIDHFRAGILGSIGAEKRLLKERLTQGEAAIQKLNHTERAKRQTFYNLMAAINKPLMAINGQLASITKIAEEPQALATSQLSQRVRFISDESKRLQSYVADFLQIEQFRQGIVEVEQQRLAVHTVLEKALLNENLSSRFPSIHVKVELPLDLPMTLGHAGLMEKAFTNLIRYAVSSRSEGQLLITGVVDSQGFLSIAMTGNVMSGESAPSSTLLDESNVFLKELASGLSINSRTEKVMSIFLSKIIFEYFGGELIAASSENPGFIINLAEVI